jgi:hypothetical protein
LKTAKPVAWRTKRLHLKPGLAADSEGALPTKPDRTPEA